MAVPSGASGSAAVLPPQQPQKPQKNTDGDVGGDGGRQRKPYVVSKPREAWTEAEHALFVEALKLYTRDWRKIQQHIKTKTAVQIRSHAQKYFQKLIKNGQQHQVPDARAKRPSGSFNKGKRRRAVQPATASGAATVASTAQLLLRTGTTAAAGGAAIRRIPSACAGSGDDIGSCSGIAYAESPDATQDGSGAPIRKSRRTARRAAMPDAQRGYDSDSEADGATTDADVAVPASSFQLPGSAQTQTLAPPLLRRDSAAQTAQLAAGRTSDSRQDVASEQPQLTAQPALWLSQGFGAFGGGLQQQQMQSVAAAEYCHPSAPLFQQAFYPVPPGYPIWQQMCSGAQPAAHGGAFPAAGGSSLRARSGNGFGGGSSSGNGFSSGRGSSSGFGFRAASASGFGSSSGSGSGGGYCPGSGSGHQTGGGNTAVPSVSPCDPLLQGGLRLPSDSIWGEELEAPAHPLATQEPPNFREMYGFIGSLFDESCRSVDHAAVLAGMPAATRNEAGRCLQRLLVNMQAPSWEGCNLRRKIGGNCLLI